MDLSKSLLGNLVLTLQTSQQTWTLGTRELGSLYVVESCNDSPDLWGGVYNEKTRHIFIWSAPSEKKIGIIIKAGGNDNLSIDFPINVPTLRTLAGPYIPYTAA